MDLTLFGILIYVNLVHESKVLIPIYNLFCYHELIGLSGKFTIAYINGYIHTENCYECNYSKLERVSDITLGDSWGSELYQENSKQGVSLILCQTDKGEELLRNSNVELKEVDLDNAVANNEQIVEGIKQGVYEAMASAMANNGSGSNVTVELHGDASDIFTAVVKENNRAIYRTGSSPIRN